MQAYTLHRLTKQPVIRTADVQASLDGFVVMGVFNPAACQVGDETILLLRVAEGLAPELGKILIPHLDTAGGNPHMTVRRFDAPTGVYDSRLINAAGQVYLTSISHLRLARSRDGLNFKIDPQPFLFPNRPDESFGIEDARITYLEGRYWITYTAVSENGPGVRLAVTDDFQKVERVGMILPPPNKDVCLFPERINGKYHLLHRPMVSEIGKPSVWLAESSDLMYWGNHRFVFGPRHDMTWEGGKIGAGPQPILTDEGWLVLYHGANARHEYALALALLDRDNPVQVLGRSAIPLMTPELSWERNGFFPNVVFSNGWIQQPNGSIRVYYGAADSGIGVAELRRGNH